MQQLAADSSCRRLTACDGALTVQKQREGEGDGERDEGREIARAREKPNIVVINRSFSLQNLFDDSVNRTFFSSSNERCQKISSSIATASTPFPSGAGEGRGRREGRSSSFEAPVAPGLVTPRPREPKKRRAKGLPPSHQ